MNFPLGVVRGGGILEETSTDQQTFTWATQATRQRGRNTRCLVDGRVVRGGSILEETSTDQQRFTQTMQV